MKKNYKLCILVCWLVAIFLASCTNDALENLSQSSNGSPEHLKNEAKAFFESVIGDYLKSHDKNNYSKSKFYPGDYTPNWDKAAVKEQDNIIRITVPIMGSRNITALCAVSTGKKATAYASSVNQFLVLEKPIDKDIYRAAYIQSIIADNSCYKKYGTKSHIKCIDPYYQDFSGLVCNYNLAGSLISIKSIQNGCITDNTDLKSHSKTNLFSTLGIVQIKNIPQTIKTKSWGEDDDDEWWRDDDEHTDWGSCLLCGGAGCFLCDDWEWSVGCSGCGGGGCMLCMDDGGTDWPDDVEIKEELNFGWEVKCPYCSHKVFIDIDEDLPSRMACPKCGKIYRLQ